MHAMNRTARFLPRLTLAESHRSCLFCRLVMGRFGLGPKHCGTNNVVNNTGEDERRQSRRNAMYEFGRLDNRRGKEEERTTANHAGDKGESDD